MSKKVYDQNTSERVPDRNQMLIVQLLFREKPDFPASETLQEQLEKFVGEVENIAKDKSDLAMFSVPKYKAEFKDAPQGIPVVANFVAPCEFNSGSVDDFTRSQFWDFKDGDEKIDEFKYFVGVFSMYAAAIDYKEQAELILAQVDAALRCFPTCGAIYVPSSGKLTTREDFEECRQYEIPGRYIRLAVNARFFTVNDTEDDMIVDTIGFFMFGGADVQMHFHGLEPDNVVNYVYNIASYQFANAFPIKSGDTVDSLDENGNMQWEPQWKTQYEDSIIQPVRTVLDINCGQYAAGTRA